MKNQVSRRFNTARLLAVFMIALIFVIACLVAPAFMKAQRQSQNNKAPIKKDASLDPRIFATNSLPQDDPGVEEHDPRLPPEQRLASHEKDDRRPDPLEELIRDAQGGRRFVF